MRRALCLVAVLLATAAAQPSAAQAPAPPPRQTTTWEMVDQSMGALLNDGHRIVSASGPLFTLEKNGRYVACEVRPAAGAGGARSQATSLCYRIN